MDATRMARRSLLGIFLVAMGILMLEVALTRVLSVVMWYHFAFVVISLAMLGLAVSGILLYFAPGLVRNAATLIPWSSRLAGITTIFALAYLAYTPFRSESASEVFSKDVA